MNDLQRKAFLLAEFIMNITRSSTFVYIAINVIIDQNRFGLLAIIAAIEGILLFLGPIIVGLFVDKIGGKPILLFLSGISTAATGLIICGVFLSIDPIYLCYSSSLILSIFSPLIKIAVFTVTPYLYPDNKHVKSNSTLVMAMQGGQLTGMLLSPFLTSNLNPLNFIWFSFSANIIAFALLYLALINIKRKIEQLSSPLRLLPVMNLSFGTMKLHEVILSSTDLILVVAFNFGLVVIISELLGSNSQLMALVEIMIACAAILTAYLITKKQDMLKHWLIIISPIAFASIFIFALLDLPILVIFSCILFGAAQTISNISWKRRIHAEVPEDNWGRVTIVRGAVSTLTITPLMYLFSQAQTISGYLSMASLALMGVVFVLANCWYLAMVEHP
jgi:MFS family permease